ncbi:hypothetical protein F5141DRAFT_1062846 [Pisolithus sp. B1]|nr:hypothetical protein F5141DRAFT_1062846 [Pisolithus sp. B1]
MVFVPLFLFLTFMLWKATPWRMLTSSSILTFKRPYEMAYPWVKLRFIRDCFELVKAMNEEQKKILRTLEADEVLLQERIVTFEQGSLNYIEHCMLIAMDILVDEMNMSCYLLMAQHQPQVLELHMGHGNQSMSLQMSLIIG